VIDHRLLTAPGGRTLDVHLAGPEGGTPVLFHHGTPGAGLPSPDLVTAFTERNLRYIGVARPGYAGSSRQPGRSVADVAHDAVAVLDELGVDRSYAMGWSGGGPHTIACAALLPDRMIAATVIASAAPYDAAGLDFLAGMGRENIDEFGAAIAGTRQLTPFLEAWAPQMRIVTGEQVADALGDLIPPIDRAALTGDFADAVAEDIRHGLEGGIWGWHDDDLAFVRPWGVDLASIRVPMTLWQGEQDRMVPFAHGAWLAQHLPAVRAHLLPDQGHLSLAVSSIGLILDELVASGAGLVS
jgi:pimeloyl-ACP methyl ester carboxylesterase